MSSEKILTVLGCLFGAAGVILMALSAHGQWPQISYPATMTLVHAPVLIAVAAAIHVGLLQAFVARVGAFLLAGAVVLFSVDVTVFAMSGSHLFPMAAPTGGTVSILAWLILAGSAAVAKDA